MNKFKLFMESLWELTWIILKPVLKLVGVILVSAILIFLVSLNVEKAFVVIMMLLGMTLLALFLLDVDERYREKLREHGKGTMNKYEVEYELVNTKSEVVEALNEKDIFCKIHMNLSKQEKVEEIRVTRIRKL